MARRGLRLDDDLRLYFPGDDLARRTKGMKYHFLADSVIIHKGKSVTRTWLATQVYFRDLLVYTRKHTIRHEWRCYGCCRARCCGVVWR